MFSDRSHNKNIPFVVPNCAVAVPITRIWGNFGAGEGN